jgi:hypothetical protein
MRQGSLIPILIVLAISASSAAVIFLVWTALAANAAPLGPHKAGLKRRAGLVIGSVLFFWGLLLLVYFQVSPRLSVTGTVAQLVRHKEGKDQSATFLVLGNGGYVTLHAGFMESELTNGSTVRAQYMAWNGALTRIEILDGPSRGWQKAENGIYFGVFALLCFGIVVCYLSFREAKLFPDGETPPHWTEDRNKAITLDLTHKDSSARHD